MVTKTFRIDFKIDTNQWQLELISRLINYFLNSHVVLVTPQALIYTYFYPPFMYCHYVLLLF